MFLVRGTTTKKCDWPIHSSKEKIKSSVLVVSKVCRFISRYGNVCFLFK